MPTTRRKPIRRSPRSKIAHLPRRVRGEIARRLRDGQSQRRVLAWLNKHPVVRDVMRREKSGRAIAEIRPQNLSAWIARQLPELATPTL